MESVSWGAHFARQWLRDAVAHTFSACLLGFVLLCAVWDASLAQFHRRPISSVGEAIASIWQTLCQPMRRLTHVWSTSGWCGSGLRLSRSPHPYVIEQGYRCRDYVVETEDGYRLLLHRVLAPAHLQRQRSRAAAIKPGHKLQGKPPVLLMHGLLQSAGVYVSTGYESLALFLVQQGLDMADPVPLPHNARHRSLVASSEAFWDWTVDDIALFDFPALVRFILRKTGHAQLHYVGHSQGNAIAFMALTRHPDRMKLGAMLASFTALAPAVAMGSLIGHWPLSAMLEWTRPSQHAQFLCIFSTRQLVPLLCWVQQVLPANVFSLLAYGTFRYLFQWSDANWDPVYKDRHFQFSPTPISTRVLLQWGSIAHAGQLIPWQPSPLIGYVRSRPAWLVVDQSTPRGHDSTALPLPGADSQRALLVDSDSGYDLERLAPVPLLLFWGTRDYLVDGKRMMQSLQASRHRIHVAQQIDDYEHMDFLWSRDAKERIWRTMVRVWSSLDDDTTGKHQ